MSQRCPSLLLARASPISRTVIRRSPTLMRRILPPCNYAHHPGRKLQPSPYLPPHFGCGSIARSVWSTVCGRVCALRSIASCPHTLRLAPLEHTTSHNLFDDVSSRHGLRNWLALLALVPRSYSHMLDIPRAVHQPQVSVPRVFLHALCASTSLPATPPPPPSTCEARELVPARC